MRVQEKVALAMKHMADGGSNTDEEAAIAMKLMDDGGSSEEEEPALAVNLLEHHGGSCSEEAHGGLGGWAPAGASTLSAHHDHVPPPLSATAEDVPCARKRKPSGRYVLAAHRADEKDGLRREICRSPKPKVTYRVAGWVCLEGGPGADGGHPVHVEVRTHDGAQVGGGVLVAEPGKWAEIKGAFRVDEHPRRAEVYVHGPPAGVDLKVMDMRVCAVDKIARLRYLRKKTDKVHVTIKFNSCVAFFLRKTFNSCSK